jgi:hypothetical protein
LNLRPFAIMAKATLIELSMRGLEERGNERD